MPNELIKFWKQCKLTAPPFAHPEDLQKLQQKENLRFIDAEPANFDAFITGSRFGDHEDHRLHLSLLPVPYSGNISHAEIVILLLNPGFSYTDYWGETNMPAFRKRMEENLQQSFSRVEFPFLYLDPQFCWHSGFVWWEKKLRDVITEIANKKFKRNYRNALRDLSKKLACLELIPYHSPSFDAHALIDLLPSVKKTVGFVQKSLVRDAEAGKRSLIVTRQSKAWGFPYGTKNTNNIIIYEGGHTRGASLGPNSEGGKAILRSYGIGKAE